MIKTFTYKGKEYPEYEKEGFASQFIIPFALKVCQGVGYDVGYGKKEWALPGAIPIENYFHNAYNLPPEKVDFIFSSHCLEHLDDWVRVLDYWIKHIKIGGVLFLYLPYYKPGKNHYWDCWNNRKHYHVFTPDIIYDYMVDRNFTKIFNGECDLNNSFAIFGERRVWE